MPLSTVRYTVRQRFPVAARRAYAWCTDYRSDDHELLGEKGSRRIAKISEDLLLLTDRWPTPEGGSVQKVKLVRLDPKEMSWTSTHLSGPARHSQFLYRILPEGNGRSRLVYTGLQVDRTPRRPTRAESAARSRQLRKEDTAAWRLYARAMESDLRG